MPEEEIKEWVRVSTSAQHVTVVTVSLVQGNLSVKRSWKVGNKLVNGESVPDVKPALKITRAAARHVLADLAQALQELDEEAA